MNQQPDDENKRPSEQERSNEQDDEQTSENDFKPNPLLFAITIICMLCSFFCYFILDLRFPAIILGILVTLVNYIATKREYEDELKKVKNESEKLQCDDNDK